MTASLTFDAPLAVGFFPDPGAITLRPGVAPLEVGISTSDAAVARPLAASVTFSPATNSTAAFKVRPGDPGVAVVRLNVPPAFHVSDSLERITVKVRRPQFRTAPITVGRD